MAVARRHRPPRQRTNSGIYQFDNYSCPHCLRKFSAKSGLKIHVGIAHKGGKLLFCPRCPASFADVTSCKSHFKVFLSLYILDFQKLMCFAHRRSTAQGVKASERPTQKEKPQSAVWCRPTSRWKEFVRCCRRRRWKRWRR